MKVKRLPEDFIVEELTDVRPKEGGLFALYRLRKTGLGTLEAIEVIQRAWKLPRKKLAWGGLKDKHAVTTQYVTIHRGPRTGLEQSNLSLEFLGWVDKAFGPGEITGNRFEITLRDFSPEEAGLALATVPAVRCDGLTNYFDDQRFGSVGESGAFIAEPWIRGDYERTIWLALAEGNAFDSSSERKEKEILRSCWGEWSECKRRLSRSHRRSIVTFLDDRSGDFKGAWARVNKDLRSLYLAAFQSQLWNELLARLLREECEYESLMEVPLKTGPLPFPVAVTEELGERLASLQLPLPSARTKPESIEDETVRGLLERTLAARGLEAREVRVKYPRDCFFSKGWRAAMIRLDALEASSKSDELHERRVKLMLRFDLPRGSYATILVKRLTDAAGIAPSGQRKR